jgi:tetratricopeptide (TPR) repeat protein
MIGCLAVHGLAAAAPALQLGGESARLQGRVYGEHGQNLAVARVRLETTEGDLVVEASPDEQGRYNFGALRRAVYHLSATADGYETFRQTVDLTRSAVHTVLDIAMTPQDRGGSLSEPPSLTDASAPRKARQEYQKGVQALAANRIPEAKAHFSRAVEKYPCYARAQAAVALGFISDRDLADAEAALKKSITCDPGYSSAYLKLGELYNIESRFRESEPLLQEGLRREPGLWKFHYQLGVAYYGLGGYDKARDEYLRSESLDPPAPPEVHVKLADVYFKERLFGKAYMEMEAYLRAEPDGRSAGKVKDLMRQMDAYRTTRARSPASVSAASAHP